LDLNRSDPDIKNERKFLNQDGKLI